MASHLDETLNATLEKAAFILTDSFSNIAIAAIVLFFGLVIGRLLGLVVLNTLKRIRFNKILSEAFGIKYNVESILSTITSVVIYFYSFLFSLSILGLNKLVISVIGIVVITVLAASALLALRDLVPNIIMGIEIQRKGLFRENDDIIMDNEEVKVIDVGLLETILEKKQGERIIIPNSIILRKEITRKNKTEKM